MPIHKDQRVGVFIDVQNLYYSAKQFYSAKVNFAHILKKAVANRGLIRAIAYVIKADIKEEHNFFEALEKIGYDVRAKDLQTFYTGAKKGDWDVGIAMDIMRMASKLDVIVLVSGDGDFKDLLEHVKALGCRAEVIAFGKTASSRLTNEADQFYDLGKDLDKVLIKDNKHVARQQKTSTKVQKPQVPPKIAGNVENVPYQRPDGSFEKNAQKTVAKKPMQRKPIQSTQRKPQFKPSGSAPFKPSNNTPYKPNNNRRPFDNRRDNNRNRPFNRDNRDRPSDEASFLQRINMDQPDLNPKPKSVVKETKKKEPVKKKVVANKPAVKETKKKAVTKKKTAKPKTTQKKVIAKKQPATKKESVVKKVLRKVTKKKK